MGREALKRTVSDRFIKVIDEVFRNRVDAYLDSFDYIGGALMKVELLHHSPRYAGPVHCTGRWRIEACDNSASRLFLEVYTEKITWEDIRPTRKRTWYGRGYIEQERIALPVPRLIRDRFWASEHSLYVQYAYLNHCGEPRDD